MSSEMLKRSMSLRDASGTGSIQSDTSPGSDSSKRDAADARLGESIVEEPGIRAPLVLPRCRGSTHFDGAIGKYATRCVCDRAKVIREPPVSGRAGSEALGGDRPLRGPLYAFRTWPPNESLQLT